MDSANENPPIFRQTEAPKLAGRGQPDNFGGFAPDGPNSKYSEI